MIECPKCGHEDRPDMLSIVGLTDIPKFEKETTFMGVRAGSMSRHELYAMIKYISENARMMGFIGPIAASGKVE